MRWGFAEGQEAGPLWRELPPSGMWSQLGRRKACFSVNASHAGCQLEMGAIFYMVFKAVKPDLKLSFKFQLL